MIKLTPSARRSKLRPLIWTIFSTNCGPDSVPATLTTDPSAVTARTSTTLRWFGLSVAVLMLASTPRSAASAGAFTNVTCSSITEENSPRNAESRSTPTSSDASSPRTCR